MIEESLSRIEKKLHALEMQLIWIGFKANMIVWISGALAYVIFLYLLMKASHR